MLWINQQTEPQAAITCLTWSPHKGLSLDDDRNRLWVWDGSKAVALRFEYDAYLFDEATRAIYLTDSVDGLTVDEYSFTTS